MKQTTFEIVRAQAQDAAELLDYLKTIGGETDNLSFGPEGVPLGLEEEQAYLRACRHSPTTICSCLPR